jgi:hypothetical protein
MGSPYICLVQAENITGVMMTKTPEGPYNIQGFTSLQEGLRYFEDSYNRAHGRSYEASMSACINAISFRPSILQMSIEEIKAKLADGAKVVQIRNVSGSMVLLPLADAEQLWESGAKPQLISN